MNTVPTKAEKALDLISSIRKGIVVDIDINNPLNTAITYEVLFIGNGLIGDKHFSLLPNSSSIYELIFLPL